MKFEQGVLYFQARSGGEALTALKLVSPFQVQFLYRSKSSTKGELSVSTLVVKPFLPYGITGSTGPWHRAENTEDLILAGEYPTPLALGLLIIQNSEQGFSAVPTLNDGLPWPLDSADYGV